MRIPFRCLPLPLFLLLEDALADPGRTWLPSALDVYGQLSAQCPAGLPACPGGDVTSIGLKPERGSFAGSASQGICPGAPDLPEVVESQDKPAADLNTNPELDETLQDVEPTAGLLSFEEWKINQVRELEGTLKLHTGAAEKDRDLGATIEEIIQVQEKGKLAEEAASEERAAKEIINDSATNGSSKAPSVGGRHSSNTSGSISPRPIAQSHRYNYASPDCSARVHSASKRSQNPSSLLHKSKDRYMLTPCSAQEHWVVIELCDEIRIEAIELGMFEFFSGVVREVDVSVGGAEEDEDVSEENERLDEDGSPKRMVHQWNSVGRFTAKNVRGSQSFSLANPTSFHRFIRLEFPSHYGNEYYCPISSAKVYGMNQMEAYKWEERRRRHEDEERRRASANPTTVALGTSSTATKLSEPSPCGGSSLGPSDDHRIGQSAVSVALERFNVQGSSASDPGLPYSPSASPVTVGDTGTMEKPKTMSSTDPITNSIAIPATIDTPTPNTSTRVVDGSSTARPTTRPTSTAVSMSSTSAGASPVYDHSDEANSGVEVAPVISGGVLSTTSSPKDPTAPSDAKATTVSDPLPSARNLPAKISSGINGSAVQSPANHSTMPSTSSTSVSPSIHSQQFRQPPRADSSESIYAYIIRRLDALEGNSSLATLYIEQQTKSTQAMLTRLESSLETWRNTVAAETNRTMEAERLRIDKKLNHALARSQQRELALEKDRIAIKAQLKSMADDILFERRRGIAQLLFTLILVVLAAAAQSRYYDGSLTPSTPRSKADRTLPPSLALPSVPQASEMQLPGLFGARRQNLEDLPTTDPHPRTPAGRDSRKAAITSPAKGWPTPIGAVRIRQDSVGKERQRPRVYLGFSNIPARRLGRSAHIHYVDTEKLKNFDRGPEFDGFSSMEGPVGAENVGHLAQSTPQFNVAERREAGHALRDGPEDDLKSASEIDADFSTDEEGDQSVQTHGQ